MEKVKVFWRMLSASCLLSVILMVFCACRREYDHEPLSSGHTRIRIDWNCETSIQKMRDAMSAENECQITNLVLMVFDSSGNRIFYGKYDRQKLTEYLNKPSGNSFNGKDAGRFEDIEIMTGRITFVLLANVMDGDYECNLTDLDAAATYEKLKAVKLKVGTGEIFRMKNIAMTAEKTVDMSKTEPAEVMLHLVRHDARVTFSVQTEDGVEFEPISYRVCNVPQYSYVLGRNPSSAAVWGGEAVWDASGSQAAGYFTSPLMQFDEAVFEDRDLVYGGGSFTFYMPENRQPARQPVLEANVVRAYNLRDKEIKTSDGHNTGTFVYAPEYAPYVEIKGYYKGPGGPDGTGMPSRREGEVTYRIHLGYFDANAFTGDNKVNDYCIERNTAYHYHMKIKGVDKIVLEAKREKDEYGDEEPVPGAEGFLVESGRHFVVDCHYEQVLFTVTKNSFKKLGDNEKVYIRFRSPFTDGEQEISYTGLELDAIGQGLNGVSHYHSKGKDLRWIWFYVDHESDKSDMQLFSKIQAPNHAEERGRNLFTPEQFLYNVFRDPQYRIALDNHPGGLHVTAFVDEYYYQCDPNSDPFYWDRMVSDGGRRTTPRDKSLWMRFCNREARECAIYFERYVSKDEKSSLLKPLVHISQLSIKTPFRSQPADDSKVLVWGVDNITDGEGMAPIKDVHYAAPGTQTEYVNMFKSNGWINTWRLLQRGPGGSEPLHKNLQMWYWGSRWDKDPRWTGRQGSSGGNLILKPEFNYLQFMPFNLNRDENRDDRIQVREIKWYIPSIAELSALNIVQRALPHGARAILRRNPGATSVGYYISSTSYNKKNGNWPYFYLPAFASMPHIKNIRISAYGNNGDQEANLRQNNEGLRAFRVLNLDDDDSGTGGYEVRNLAHNPGNNRLKFTFESSDPLCFRSERWSYGELPPHDENSSINRIYRGGFQVAKEPIKETTGVPMKRTWGAYNTEIINKGYSPCTYYVEDGVATGWRLPNLAEMNVMAYMLFDWTNPDISNAYPELGITGVTSFYADHFAGHGAGGWMLFMSRTHNRIDKNGYGLYIYAAAAGISGVSERSVVKVNFPYYNYMSDASNISLRCVRDL